MYLHHKEINVSSSSTFERKIVVYMCCGGFFRNEGRKLRVLWGCLYTFICSGVDGLEWGRNESKNESLGFIGFSCAVQCFLCALLSNFQRQFWEMSLTVTIFYMYYFIFFLHALFAIVSDTILFISLPFFSLQKC